MPLAAEMLYEKMTAHNLFFALGEGPSGSAIREGHIRARGPFAHAILAGSVGAVCIPFMIGIWRQHRKTAIAGIFACTTMVVTSVSSGPILSTIAAIAALYMWRYRQNMRLIRWVAVISYIGLDLVMKAPAYYIIYRFDITRGSTGYHRAALIESALKHINEWWLAGTDSPRHWMPTGVSWSPDHTDITNQYLEQGVVGGLPLMFLFIAIMGMGFSLVGQSLQQGAKLNQESQFMVWAIGASLFTYAVTFISVSFFDQSILFYYFTLAAIGSAGSGELS